ncbi:MAG: YhgE/Pip family protein, partial [Corynebacterium variabile]|nr:YhgE/Pip family protein [Corynebacterium variabile]
MIRSAVVKESWSVFARDAGRLLRTPKVWVIVIGVLFTPALYAWVNVAAFWDPYGNTGNIRVAVVNEDKGGDSDLTGELDVGARVVDQLKENDQLGWQFMDADEADDALHKGDVYASITVPDTFTSDIL